jgi:hypothetical protein
MGRPNPKNNPTMQRVEAPAPPPKKTPPPVKTKRPTRSQPTHRPTPDSNIRLIPNTQSRNVTQPVKKQTDWCNCEFWDVGCKAGCLAQEQIVDPVVSGTDWLAGGVDVHVTQPITEGVQWWQGGFDEAYKETELAYKETEKFFGDATDSTLEAVKVAGENFADAWDSTMQFGADVQTNLTTIGEDVQETLAGGTQWLQDQASTAGNMFNDIARMPSGFGSMLGNMMRGMGNLANVGSSSMGWIKWVLIAIGALIAGFIAWRVLK